MVKDHSNETVSCSRAGLFIIIICGLGLSLLGPVETRIAPNDLARYIALRTAFAAQLGELERTPCASNKDVALKILSGSDCFKNYPEESNPAFQAMSALNSLNNIGELEKARRGYYVNNYSIYKWKLRVNSILRSGINYQNMTLRTAQELSDFEYPELSQYELLFRKFTVLDTQWTPLTVQIVHAVTYVELGLLISLAYFWLMFFEATKSGTSTREGTIFTAVRRTQFTRFLFLVFVSLPSFVALLLLRQSYRFGEVLQSQSLYNIPWINELLFAAVLFMSINIWRTAQIDWSEKSI